MQAQFGFFGGDINLSLGAIDVGAGGVLRFDNATVTTGGLADWRGEGVVEITGNTTFTLNSNMVLDADSPTFDLTSGTLTINPDSSDSLTIAEGAELNLVNGDQINAELNLDGSLAVRGTGNTVAGDFYQFGSLLVASNNSGQSVLDLGTNLTNNALVIFDQDGTSGNKAVINVVGGAGSIVNEGSENTASGLDAVIRSVDTGGTLGATAHHLNGALANYGWLDVQHNLLVSGTSAAHVNENLITIAAGQTLTFTGSSFANAAGFGFGAIYGAIEGEGTLDVSGLSFVQDAILDPAGAGIGTLTVVGNVQQSFTSLLNIDVQDTLTHDVLLVSGGGSAYESEGFIDLNFLPGHDITPAGATLTVVNAPSVSNASVLVNHNLAAGYDATASTTATTVDVTISDGFEKTFLANSSVWSNLLNWLLSSAPNASDDVLIDGANAVTSSGAVSINSLSLEDTATLTITDGLFQLADTSRTSVSTTLTLNTSASGTGQLDTGSTLIVDGTLSWQNETLTGGEVIVNGHLDLVLGNSSVLNADLTVVGTGLIQSFGDDLTGSGILSNQGDLAIQGLTNIGVSTVNDTSGELIVEAQTGLTQVDFQSEVENYGLFVVDSQGAFDASVSFGGSYFDNSGTLQILNTGGQVSARVITAFSSFYNGGLIDVDHDVTLDANGAFVTLEGQLDVAAGKTMEITGAGDGVLISLDESASFLGTGTLLFSNTSVGSTMVDLFGDYVFNAPGFVLDFGVAPVTLGGSTASLTIAAGSMLEIPDTTLVDSLLPVYNEGDLTLSGASQSVLSSFENREGATLTIAGSGGNKEFDNFDVNEGTINFTATGGGVNSIEFGAFSSVDVFTNYGTINVDHVAASGPSEFRGLLNNDGVLNVGYDLAFLESDLPVEHINNGLIDVQAGWTLEYATANDLFNDYRGEIFGEGTIDVSAASFFNDGVISPGNGTGGLTIVGDIDFGRASEIAIEIGGPVQGIDYDVLDVTGGTLNLRGRLNVALTNAFTPTTGNTFTIILGTLVGSFDTVYGLDFSATAIFDLVDLGTSLELDTVAVTNAGTAFADSIVGTGGSDIIVAGAGADYITQISSGDTVYGQRGDDVIEADATATRIDGGSGIDRLVMPENIDYVALAGHTIEHIEILSLRDGAGAQTIQLDADAISKIVDGLNGLTGEYNSLVVTGNAGDRVELAGDFSPDGAGYIAAEGIGELFDRFVDPDGVTLYLDQFTELEVARPDGSKVLFGGPADDTLVGTGLDDYLNGRTGADNINAGAGDDVVTRDGDDVAIDGGAGFDTLLFSDAVDLTNVTNFEVMNMEDGVGETVNLTFSEVLSASSTDASLDLLLGNSLPSLGNRLIIQGDVGDSLVIGGQDLSDISGLALADNQSLGAFDDIDFASTISISGESYYSFSSTSNGLQLLVHENLVDPDPVL